MNQNEQLSVEAIALRYVGLEKTQDRTLTAIAATQVRENYGAHDWDGTGTCPQHWKNKGGELYMVRNLTPEHVQDEEFWTALIAYIESGNGDYFAEHLIMQTYNATALINPPRHHGILGLPQNSASVGNRRRE